jgi:hypothetical protein
MKGIWSVHWCDIFTAVEQGCPIDIGRDEGSGRR